MERLKAWPIYKVGTLPAKVFYNDIINPQYIDDRRAELKALAGLKPSSPKAPKQRCEVHPSVVELALLLTKVPNFSFVHLPYHDPKPKKNKDQEEDKKKKKVLRIGEKEAPAV